MHSCHIGSTILSSLFTWTQIYVITDHAALAYLKNMKNPVGRLGRWLMTFNSYDMEIINRPGKLHSNVDTLSWIQH